MKTVHRTLFAVLFSALTASGAEAQSRVTINIDAGESKTHEVVIELDEENAPKTSTNFKKLAGEGFYDKIAFHRVVADYIVQVGDPLTKDPEKKSLWGTGGPGYSLPAELGQKHLRGSVAMARLSDGVNPNRASNGSQFYICLTDIPSLDGNYTVFGKVVSGLDHIERISRAAADNNHNPVSRIDIVSTDVEEVDNVASAAAATPPADPDVTPEAAKEMDRASTMPEPSTGEVKDGDELDKPKEIAASVLAAAEAAMEKAGADEEGEFAALVAAAREKAGLSKPASSSDDRPDPERSLPRKELPSNSGNGTTPQEATAPLTQPVAKATPVASAVPSDGRQEVQTRSDADADSPDSGSEKPKKKEGFFTRMIKKVW